MTSNLPYIIGTLGIFLDFLGKLMVSFTAVKVHHRVWKEHKIDDVVFNEMRHEARVGITGIVLMSFGFILEFAERILVN